MIQPTESLGADFVYGWHKPPDELKMRMMRMLAVNLYLESSIRYSTSINRYDVTEFLRHLKSTPEVARLSRDIYYTSNAFTIEESRHSSTGVHIVGNGRMTARYMIYQQPSLNTRIRSVTFEICSFGGMTTTHIRRFANGDCGFENLRQVKFVIRMRTARWQLGATGDFATDDDCAPIRFGCDGQVNFDVLEVGMPEADADKSSLLALQARIAMVFVFGCIKDKRGVRAEAEETGSGE